VSRDWRIRILRAFFDGQHFNHQLGPEDVAEAGEAEL
jgi:hypothetical protein